MITIVDYGMGNLGSILNMIKKTGFAATITSDKNEILKAKKLVLPGVGSFDSAMNNLENLDLIEILNKKALDERIPILGICLGMQIMTNSSEEGRKKGFGWINASTINFPFSREYKIPHMGWNIPKSFKKHEIFKNLDSSSKFYFVHSYFVETVKKENSLMKVNYGITFDAAIFDRNIIGLQFHPEKSHKYGMEIFKNFAVI